jgi:hypothetical protein
MGTNAFSAVGRVISSLSAATSAPFDSFASLGRIGQWRGCRALPGWTAEGGCPHIRGDLGGWKPHPFRLPYGTLRRASLAQGRLKTELVPFPIWRRKQRIFESALERVRRSFRLQVYGKNSLRWRGNYQRCRGPFGFAQGRFFDCETASLREAVSSLRMTPAKKFKLSHYPRGRSGPVGILAGMFWVARRRFRCDR